MTLHYLIIFGILHGPYTHRPFRSAFYRPQSNYIRAIEPIHDITGHRSLVSRRSARTVTPVTITPPSMTPASCNFIVIRDKPASFLPDLASGHFISHPLRPRALREGGQWNSSLRISERHPTSPTPPSSLRPLSLHHIPPPAASSPARAFHPPAFISLAASSHSLSPYLFLLARPRPRR